LHSSALTCPDPIFDRIPVALNWIPLAVPFAVAVKGVKPDPEAVCKFNRFPLPLFPVPSLIDKMSFVVVAAPPVRLITFEFPVKKFVAAAGFPI
jgi:hypothetical protein